MNHTLSNNAGILAYQGSVSGLKAFDGLLSKVDADQRIDNILLDTDLAWKMSKTEIAAVNPDGISDPSISEKHSGVWATHELTGETQFTESIVGRESFTFTQNREVIEQLWQLVNAGLLVPTFAGSIDRHTKAFMHFHAGDAYEIDGDPHQKGFIATWAHDGSGALNFRPMVHRLFCLNQVPMGRFYQGSAPAVISIKHTKAATWKMATVARQIAESLDQMEAYDRFMGQAIERLITGKQFNQFVERLIPIDPKIADKPEHLLSTGEKRSRTIAENKRAAVRDIYMHSATQSNLFGTAAGAYHAAVEAFDHRFTGNRGRRLLLGQDEAFKATAADLALAL